MKIKTRFYDNIERYLQWHTFFAWYPVRMDMGEYRWLEKVERCGVLYRSTYRDNITWRYRPIQKEK